MAEKRMFAKTIIDSDAFLDMPLSTQALYFHLAMRADDEGFINNPKKIQRTVGSTDDDLKLLMLKNFIIPFESGIVVIKHWKIHNYIRTDRLKPTAYQEEKGQLSIKKNGAYTLCQADVSQLSGRCPADVSIDKIRLDEIRVEESSKEESIGGAAPVPPTPEKEPKRKYGQYGWVKLTEAEYQRLISEFGERVASHYISYVDESAEQTGNKNKWKNWNLTVRKAIRGKWGGGVPESGGWKEFD